MREFPLKTKLEPPFGNHRLQTLGFLDPPILVSSFSLLFRFAIILAFLDVFALFSKDFEGSAERKILVFL